MIGIFLIVMSLAAQAGSMGGSMGGLKGFGLGQSGFVKPLSELVDEVHLCGHSVVARALDVWQRNLRPPSRPIPWLGGTPSAWSL
jgi:hypothetical protein